MKEAPKSPVSTKTTIRWTLYIVVIGISTVIYIACQLMTDTPGMSSTFYLVAAIFGVIVCVCEVVGIYLLPSNKDDDADD